MFHLHVYDLFCVILLLLSLFVTKYNNFKGIQIFFFYYLKVVYFINFFSFKLINIQKTQSMSNTFKLVFFIGNIVLVVSIINISHSSNLLLSNGYFCK